jgi:pSer/pThr/pTyr-binding forkhead associated (FHA) protein
MSTQTTPKPFGPVATPGPGPSRPALDRPTAPLEAAAAEEALAALPLLDHRGRQQTIPAALAPRGHYLALADGDETRLLRLKDITHIGRGPGSDARFDEHRVSRSHAIFVRHGRHFRVLDNRSSNGTFVNGRRIIATNIQNGDVIRVGPVAMQYVAIE